MCAGCVTAEDKLDNVTSSEKEREEGGGTEKGGQWIASCQKTNFAKY